MIEIRNGCSRYPPGAQESLSWVYQDAKSAGVLTYYFTAPYGIIPKIGDYINDDTWTWVERTEYKIVPNLEPQFPDEDEFTFRR